MKTAGAILGQSTWRALRAIALFTALGVLFVQPLPVGNATPVLRIPTHCLWYVPPGLPEVCIG